MFDMIAYLPKRYPLIQPHPLNHSVKGQKRCKMFQMTVIGLKHPINEPFKCNNNYNYIEKKTTMVKIFLW